MPLKVEIFKSYQGERWENVYLVRGPGDPPSETPFPDVAFVIANAEREIHLPSVTFEYARVSTVAEGDNSFVTVPIGFNGLRPGSDAGTPLPLWNTLRVDLLVEIGRPSRKFFRGVLGEADIDYMSVAEGIRTNAQVMMNAMITELTATANVTLVDPQGQEIYASQPYNRVQMRQLTRGRRRRAVGGGGGGGETPDPQ